MSTSIFAETFDCGIVSTRTSFVKNNEYKLKLFHLGKIKQIIALAPGKHKLSAKIIYEKSNFSDSQNTFELINHEKTSKLIDFNIDVKKNQVYYIVAKTNDKPKNKSSASFEIIINKQKTKECDSNEIVQPTEGSLNADNTIPENLQYRLDLVMNDLQSYFSLKDQPSKTITLAKDERLSKILGIVTETKPTSTSGIKVLAITQFSTAAKIGLLPGDIILRVNEVLLANNETIDKKDQSMLSLFKHTLTTLTKGENLTVEVRRHQNTMQLKSNYNDLSLPPYRLTIQIN